MFGIIPNNDIMAKKDISKLSIHKDNYENIY